MATFNLLITYPDGEQARILAALKAHYGVSTNADAIEGFRVSTAKCLRDIVLTQEQQDAVNTARNAVNPTNPS